MTPPRQRWSWEWLEQFLPGLLIAAVSVLASIYVSMKVHEDQMSRLGMDMQKLDEALDRGILPIASERIEVLRGRVVELERKVSIIEMELYRRGSGYTSFPGEKGP